MAEHMTNTISGWFEEHGDFPENLEPTVDEPVCEVCGADNPARTKDESGTLMCEGCLDDALFEPCCFASTMHFGTGDHEWGCPNY